MASNLLNGNKTKPNYAGVPSVAFAVPPLAAIGLQEAVAREQGLRFRERHENTSGWDSSRRIAKEYSGFKVLIEEARSAFLALTFWARTGRTPLISLPWRSAPGCAPQS